MEQAIVVINTGSSNIKFSFFTYPALKLLQHGQIGYETGLEDFFKWFTDISKTMSIKAVGHRVVHGGMVFSDAVLITDAVISKIADLIPLAPLHQSYNLEVIQRIQAAYPALPQIACFDTVFHRTQDRLATLFALPQALTAEGIIRYGFHGISYQYIASVLTQHIGEKCGNGRVIVAHLGNGASLCALFQRKSVAASMGFTALDGLMMGTRCGSIDPGVILYLLQAKKFSAEKISTLLYQESGLLGVSGLSNDMRVLLSSTDPQACEAVDLFCYRAARELSALCMTLQGCDAIVFTAGIGENCAMVRKKICDRLKWLEIILDEGANQQNAVIISQKKSNVVVAVIHTDEERMIAEDTVRLCR